MLKDLVVFDQMLKITRIDLGQEGIQETAAFFAASGDDLDIVRSDDDSGEASDMGREFLIGLAVGQEFFLPRFPQDTDDLHGLPFFLKIAFDAEAGRALPDVLLVSPGKITFCKTEVVDGIQQIGLPHTIRAADADDPFPEPEGRLLVIFKLYESYILQ